MISSYVTEGRLAVHFPRLMRATHNPGLIVLFSGENVGTVVSVGHSEQLYHVAHICDSWDPRSFELFDGEVSLCNDADEGDEFEGHEGKQEEGDAGPCFSRACGGGQAAAEAASQAGDIFINGSVVESGGTLYTELMKALSAKTAR